MWSSIFLRSWHQCTAQPQEPHPCQQYAAHHTLPHTTLWCPAVLLLQVSSPSLASCCVCACHAAKRQPSQSTMPSWSSSMQMWPRLLLTQWTATSSLSRCGELACGPVGSSGWCRQHQSGAVYLPARIISSVGASFASRSNDTHTHTQVPLYTAMAKRCSRTASRRLHILYSIAEWAVTLRGGGACWVLACIGLVLLSAAHDTCFLLKTATRSGS